MLIIVYNLIYRTQTYIFFFKQKNFFDGFCIKNQSNLSKTRG